MPQLCFPLELKSLTFSCLGRYCLSALNQPGILNQPSYHNINTSKRAWLSCYSDSIYRRAEFAPPFSPSPFSKRSLQHLLSLTIYNNHRHGSTGLVRATSNKLGAANRSKDKPLNSDTIPTSNLNSRISEVNQEEPSKSASKTSSSLHHGCSKSLWDLIQNYLLYAQIPEIGLPGGGLARIKSPRLGRVVEIEADQSSFKTFKASIFNHLRVSSNKYPLNEIGRRADHKGLLNWYYAIREPDCEPVKGFLISLPPYFAEFMRRVEHASTNAKIAIKLWMSHEVAREVPATILEISTVVDTESQMNDARRNSASPTVWVLDSGSDQRGDDCNTASTPAFSSRAASDSPAASDRSGSMVIDPEAGPNENTAKKNIADAPNHPPSATHTFCSEFLRSPPEMLVMEDFLVFCHVRASNVQETITEHEITHWIAFIGATEDELTLMGFKWGSRKLLLAGVRKACNFYGYA
ncbi:hypothetical protein PCASD_06477 [Puccinia coronata f. sp. avenae]|uniref:Uncharacterized protein n=1 Tax=Puccinia coronata f. sp. avenae TaxID=200324 RepID=A0A2N5V204_9BASI|nr:hypothetical protein PCASD_06477 [Puccinia coronata f. sp. avenae]